MITVSEFMTADLCTLSESDTIKDARAIMTEKHIRHIPITDEDNNVLGLVTQRDVLAATRPEALQDASDESQDADIRLSEIMVRDVRHVLETDSLRQAALFMQSHKYGCLLVVSSGKLVGIITDSDFVSIAINLLEQAEMSEDAIEQGITGELEDMELPETGELL